MFTGIVTAVGTVDAVHVGEGSLRITVRSPYDDLVLGESVAVNGACLTVVDAGDGWFAVDAVVTTRGRTTFDAMRVGQSVNLERALRVGERLGGHFVQGHVDGIAQVVAVVERDDAVLVDVEVPPDVADVSVLHGSITLDGVSLTVNALPRSGVVQVALIPFTRRHTTFASIGPGDRVHVEGDMLGKFVREMLQTRGNLRGAEEV
jgi:riboflavin synthase